MKKMHFLTLLLCLMMATGISANNHRISKITTTTTEGDVDTYYLYNAQNQLMWVQGTSTRDVYTYNEKGQLTVMTTLSWVPNDKAYKVVNTETYSYDAEGRVSEMEQLKNIGTTYARKYVYSDYKYEDGEAVSWHMADVRETAAYQYDYKVILEKDGQGRITSKKVEEYDYDYPEDGFCAFEGFAYTYKENGDIDTEVYSKYNYAYDKVKKTETSVYSYSTLDAACIPSGIEVKSTAKGIELSWNAVEGATAYAVTYDLEHVSVEGTSLTVKDIAIGEHEFCVQAIVGGEEKNASEPVVGTMRDPGMLAAENLQAGEPTMRTEDTDNGKRTFCIIPFTWVLPQGHSEIKDIRLYYTSAIHGTMYQAVGKQDATSFELKIDEYDVRNTNEQGEYTEGTDMDFYVTIVYGSGESEKSNIVQMNPYNLANGIEDGIVDVDVNDNDNDNENENENENENKSYTLTGARAVKGMKGIVIKNGKKTVRN